MKRFFTITALLTTFLLAACSAPENEFVFALKPDKDPDRMLEEQKSLENFLSERLDRPVSVIIPLSGSIILEGFANGTIDAGYVSATEMVYARNEQTADLLLAGEINGNPYYESYWVSLKDKPYESVEDLKGKPIAFSSRSSTSGFIIPFWDMNKKGLVDDDGKPEDFFGEGNVWYGIGYVSAVEQVLSGAAEAAAVSYYVIDEDRHLTEEQRAKLKMVTSQGPVPTHVIAASRQLGEEGQAKLREALLEFNNEEHKELRDKLFTSRLIEVDPQDHLQSIAEAIEFAKNVTR
ncbi:MAG TPA: phosphate/phosphite/phosphonate ABC transporter substrate-binding protein [Opitutales bacterium]|nr:phosphate/phosphite/phosphonate ABC transporter substrate-binding protein [Opitutales bacterium]